MLILFHEIPETSSVQLYSVYLMRPSGCNFQQCLSSKPGLRPDMRCPSYLHPQHINACPVIN